MALVTHLKRHGIGHCFASSLLKARAGSRHGYDIVDHNALNPEIGSRDDFVCAVLGEHFGKLLVKAEIKLTFESGAGA